MEHSSQVIEKLTLNNHLLFIFFVRLEKEYTTIKNKEMEEQIEIKVFARVRIAWYVYHSKRFEYDLINGMYCPVTVSP